VRPSEGGRWALLRFRLRWVSSMRMADQSVSGEVQRFGMGGRDFISFG
jgi:hypothetical protein